MTAIIAPPCSVPCLYWQNKSKTCGVHSKNPPHFALQKRGILLPQLNRSTITMKHITTQPHNTRQNVLRAIHLFVWTLLVAKVFTLWLLPALEQGSRFGIWIQDGTMTILDFPLIFNAVKRAWYGNYPPGASIYSSINTLKVTSNWAQQTGGTSYSPAILLLLAPLVSLSHGAAYFLFNLAGLFFIWWQTFPERCRYGISLIIFFGPLSMGCFELGQTVLLTGAGLLYLHEKTREITNDSPISALLPSGIVLWLLTAKPPLAITSIAVLIGLRRWRLLKLSAVITATGTIMLSPFLGHDWYSDYLHLLMSYNRVQTDPASAQLFNPSHMANLRAVLSVNAGMADHIASKISMLLWLPMLMLVAGAGSRLCLSQGALWALGILSYLSFCPHVTSTEELQLLLLIPLCIPAQTDTPLRWQETLLLVATCLLPFMSPAVGPFESSLGLFVGKLMLAGFIAIQWRETAAQETANFSKKEIMASGL